MEDWHEDDCVWPKEESVASSDRSHRKHNLLAIDSLNPNAWKGAAEYLKHTVADFAVIQEARVSAAAKDETESTVRRDGWRMAISACGKGVEGGNSAGVAVGCRNHIGMRDAYPEFGVPELEQRLTLEKVDCAARGGLNLGSCYLISGTGIATTKNLDRLHCLAGMLKRISGPWIIGGDFNGTPEELAATGWLKVVGGRIHRPKMPTCGERCLDFCVSSMCIVDDIVDVKLVADNTSPHSPVRLYMKTKIRRTRQELSCPQSLWGACPLWSSAQTGGHSQNLLGARVPSESPRVPGAASTVFARYQCEGYGPTDSAAPSRGGDYYVTENSLRNR